MNTSLGQTIRQARKSRGWSLKTFSEKIGISIMTLQRIETGQVSPSVRLMIEIADNLDRPITDFIKDKERTLVRLKSARLKNWSDGSLDIMGIYPQGVIENNLGVNLADMKAGQTSNWVEEDYYKGYHVLEGGVTLEFEDEKMTVGQGETIYYDARSKHRLVADQDSSLVVVNRR